MDSLLFEDVLKSQHAALEEGGGASAKAFGDGKLPILVDLTMASEDINGLQFCQLVVCGFLKLFRHHRHLNKINVFPVADGDTGSNMVICLKRPSKNLLMKPDENIVMATTRLACDVLLCGQVMAYYIRHNSRAHTHTHTLV